MKTLLLSLLLLTACSPADSLKRDKERKVLEMQLTKQCIKEAAILGPQNNAHKVIEECSQNAFYDAITLSR